MVAQSGGEVNRLLDRRLVQRLPAIDAAHGDLPRGQRRLNMLQKGDLHEGFLPSGQVVAGRPPRCTAVEPQGCVALKSKLSAEVR